MIRKVAGYTAVAVASWVAGTYLAKGIGWAIPRAWDATMNRSARRR